MFITLGTVVDGKRAVADRVKRLKARLRVPSVGSLPVV